MENNQYRALFESHDPQGSGLISSSDFIEILRMLGKTYNKPIPAAISYEESLAVLQQSVPAELKLRDFLRLLENYQRECENNQNYSEAKKAKVKCNELKKKETRRQLSKARNSQVKQLKQLDRTQQQQQQEFNSAWHNYMADYEATVHKSIGTLREKHQLEFQEFSEKTVRAARLKVKHSRHLLDLRARQETLARQEKYSKAEELKRKGDEHEAWETAKNEAAVQGAVAKREKHFKREQKMALDALLKRVQRDRNEQLRHRDEDLQKLLQRNKNTRNEVVARHNGDARKTVEDTKRQLGGRI